MLYCIIYCISYVHYILSHIYVTPYKIQIVRKQLYSNKLLQNSSIMKQIQFQLRSSFTEDNGVFIQLNSVQCRLFLYAIKKITSGILDTAI